MGKTFGPMHVPAIVYIPHKHDFDPVTEECIHCHLPRHALLSFDIECSGSQNLDGRAII